MRRHTNHRAGAKITIFQTSSKTTTTREETSPQTSLLAKRRAAANHTSRECNSQALRQGNGIAIRVFDDHLIARVA